MNEWKEGCRAFRVYFENGNTVMVSVVVDKLGLKTFLYSEVNERGIIDPHYGKTRGNRETWSLTQAEAFTKAGELARKASMSFLQKATEAEDEYLICQEMARGMEEASKNERDKQRQA